MKNVIIIEPFELKKTEQFLGFKLTSFELEIARNQQGFVRVLRNGRIFNIQLNTIPFKELYSESFQEDSEAFGLAILGNKYEK